MAGLKIDGRLRIAVLDRNIFPFVFQKDGKLFGADVDMASDLAARLGLEPVFVLVSESYDSLVQTVAEGRADIGVSELAKTMDRSQMVFFSRPYMFSGFTVLVNRLSAASLHIPVSIEEGERESLIISSLNTPELHVSTMSGSATVGILAELFPDASHHFSGHWRESAGLVYSGDLDAALLADSAYMTIIQDNPEFLFKVKEYHLDIADPLVVAVRPGLPDLLRLVNDYLDVTEQKHITNLSDLVNRYMGSRNKPSEQRIAEQIPPASFASDWILVVVIHIVVFVMYWLLVIRRNKGKHWLLKPWAVFCGMALGGVTGSLLPFLSFFAGPLSGIYLNFWKLCVLPIMITIVITSVFRLLTNQDNYKLVKRLLAAIPSSLLVIALIGLMAGVWVQPGADFSRDAQQMLIVQETMARAEIEDIGIFEQFVRMAHTIVPNNLLKPIVENQALAVLFIALFFGIMLARIRNEGRETVFRFLEAVLGVFTGMVRVSLYLLPLALYLLTLDFTARTGFDLLKPLLLLAGCMTLALLPVLALSVVFLRHRLGISLFTLFQDFTPMFLVALSSRSSVIAMPLGLETLRGRRCINQDQAMAAFPLLLMLCHCGYAVFFSLVPVFIGQVFGVDFTMGQYAFIVAGAALSSMAATGSIAMSHVMLLPIICVPLNLPLESAILVGFALLNIMSPFSAAIQTVFSSGLTAALVGEKCISKIGPV